MNRLYFGDCLDILRSYQADETVDLIYLDPPFNSKRDYSILFKSPKGHDSDAQITAFEDTWHWGMQAEAEFDEILQQSNTEVAALVHSLRRFLGENDMMAYLVMMTSRLLEMHRVLKPTGSLYLHCDPTASHYLKIVLDGVFGKVNYRTEISWKRSSAHSDAKQGRQQYGNIRDVIFFYTKSSSWAWNWQYTPYSEEYTSAFYKHVEEETGRRYRLDNLSGPGGAAKGNPKYEVLGVTRYWRYKQEKMEQMVREGRVVQTRPGTVPAYKRYLDEMPGVPLQNDWSDIKPAGKGESLGYPTQKPLALLERIIATSSNEGDVVLDPFCGCDTAVHAAQKLKREWIGVDITHLAIGLIEERVKGKFPRAKFEVVGRPTDLEGARALAARDKYQFQWWACHLIGMTAFTKKGSDGGIDGHHFFKDGSPQPQRIIVSVKGGDHVNVLMVKDLIATVQREQAAIGILVTLIPPTQAMKSDAAAAGFYASPRHGKFPKIQILTIEGILSGTERPFFPDMSGGTTAGKKIRPEVEKADQEALEFD